MANTITQTLIRSFKTKSKHSLPLIAATTPPPSPARLVALRGYSPPPDAAPHATGDDWEAVAVQRIENAVHRIIMIKSVPDWLPFVPGASYFVPPKRPINGLPQLMHQIANPLSEEEQLSLTNVRGWPSSQFCASPEMEKSTSVQLKDLKSQVD